MYFLDGGYMSGDIWHGVICPGVFVLEPFIITSGHGTSHLTESVYGSYPSIGGHQRYNPVVFPDVEH